MNIRIRALGTYSIARGAFLSRVVYGREASGSMQRCGTSWGAECGIRTLRIHFSDIHGDAIKLYTAPGPALHPTLQTACGPHILAPGKHEPTLQAGRLQTANTQSLKSLCRETRSVVSKFYPQDRQIPAVFAVCLPAHHHPHNLLIFWKIWREIARK